MDFETQSGFPEAPPPAGSEVPPPATSLPAPAKARGSIYEVLVVVLLALFIALLLKVYVAEAYEIRGRSMEPSFKEDERVMVLKVLYDIQRGDVIIFSSAENCQKDLIKRVIGLPGDHVKIKDGVVSINGKRLDEPYLRKAPFHYREEKEEWVPTGKYYVLGDNRPDSQDSRVFHSIDAATIKGKVILRWWPVKDMKSF